MQHVVEVEGAAGRGASADAGKSWMGCLVSNELACPNPDGFQSPDGGIVVSLDHNSAKDREILMTRFTKEDGLAGRLVSSGSQLKRLVNQALGPKPDRLPWY